MMGQTFISDSDLEVAKKYNEIRLITIGLKATCQSSFQVRLEGKDGFVFVKTVIMKNPMGSTAALLPYPWDISLLPVFSYTRGSFIQLLP
jgi:hypothetical protein